ncbi:MAG: aminotransferase class I/II-fold pyridoxal phosphate-dependent enzyme [Cellvibrionaceae bacterium]
MIFPEYELNKFQAHYNAKAQYRMCTAGLSPLSMSDIFSLANEKERSDWNNLSLTYADEKGDAELRDLIAKQYPGLSAKHIVTFCGTQEALFCTLQSTTNPNDHVITIDPAYEPLCKLPESMGARISKIALYISPISESPIHTTHESSRWSLPLDTLLSTANTGFKQLIINFPHNPTGCMIDTKTQDSLINCCHDQNAWLISDEVFRGLEHNPDKQLVPIASLYKKGVSLGSIGKPFGLGGIRIGWVACQDISLLEKIIQIKRSLSICTSRADEWIAKIVLLNSQKLLNANRTLLNKHIQLLNANSTTLKHFHWIMPEAGSVAFPSTSQEADIDSYADKLIQNTGIMIIPGRCFSNSSNLQQHFRIGFGQKNFADVWEKFSNFSLSS